MALTVPPDFTNGVLTPAKMQQLSDAITQQMPIVGNKTTDQTVNNSATLVNDSALFAAVEASATYELTLSLLYQSNATPDIKLAWTYPTGLTLRYGLYGVATTFQGFYMTELSGPVLDGSGANVAVLFYGRVATDATAGTLQLQWAQNAANVSDTIVRAGSVIVLRRLS